MLGESFFTHFIRMPSRKNRSVSRKNRASRKNRGSSRKNRSSRSRRNRCWKGGMAPLSDQSMSAAQRDSLAQGSQYLNIHKNQHGGAAAPYPTAVTNSVLTGSMIAAARTGPLDAAISQIQGMQDGGKRSRHRKGKKHSRKHKGGRSRKHSRKHHKKHRGGRSPFAGAPVSADTMMLPAGMDKQAALHNEWADAKNPNAFVPKA